MKISAGLRRLWLNVHLWLGVALLLPLAMIGLSGSLLEFQNELGPLITPQRYAVSEGPAVAPSVLLETTRSGAGENFVVASLRFPARDGDPVIANARGKGRQIEGRPPQSLRLWLDPASGRVLDSADPRGGIFGVAHQLHGSLLIPDVGRKVVGWLGWSLLVSALTGLWLWWPRGAFWRGFGWGRGPLFTYNLHHLFGFWIAIPLAVVAASGVYISFPQSAGALTNALTHTAAHAPGRGESNPRGGAPLEHTTLPIDAVADLARTAAPGARLVSLTLPSRPRGEGVPTWRAELQDGAETLQLTFQDAPQAAAHRGGQGRRGRGRAARSRRARPAAVVACDPRADGPRAPFAGPDRPHLLAPASPSRVGGPALTVTKNRLQLRRWPNRSNSDAFANGSDSCRSGEFARAPARRCMRRHFWARPLAWTLARSRSKLWLKPKTRLSSPASASLSPTA